jgi:hypothetical protein
MQFTLRDLLWLITVVGLSIAWYLDHRWEEGEGVSVTGVVTRVTGTLVEVSLGADDGIENGSEFKLHRGNANLGQITIQFTDPDRAVGRLHPFHGDIQKGDKATTKIIVSSNWCGT